MGKKPFRIDFCGAFVSAPEIHWLNERVHRIVLSSFAKIFAAILLVSPLASAAQNPPAQDQTLDQPVGPASLYGKNPPGTGQDDVTLRLDVRRVPVDVVVTDKQGNPVRGLTRADFTVKEDKVEQTVLSFDYQDGSAPSFVPPKLPALPANTFVNLPAQPEQGPLYVLYYDMVNTPMEDQASAHQQLLDFIDNAKPGTRFALFVNAAGLHLIQGFTSDHALLHAAVLSKGPGPHVPQVFLYGNTYGATDAGAALHCLTFLADYLSGIPGRKNLIWLSSVFPIPVAPTMVTGGDATGTNSVNPAGGPVFLDLTELLKESLKKTYASMMRSQVALYLVDLKGVDAADAPGNKILNYQYEDTIASTTGGRAYHGNNRIEAMIDKAVVNGESYYTLSYSPINRNFDGSERKIDLTLADAKENGYTVTYRTVYYAMADDNPQQPAKKKVDALQARFVAAKAEDTLYANIEHGAPMVHDLLFSAHIATKGKPQLATDRQMAELQDSPVFFRTRRKDTPQKPLPPVKLQKYVIDYGVIDQQLKTQAASNGTPATLEFAAAAYDDDGRLLNSELNEGQAPAGSKAAAKPGALFHADQELEVPDGAAWIRVAVRDKFDNRTGTLEVKLPLKPETTATMAAKPN
jgi:VWFA-related protein